MQMEIPSAPMITTERRSNDLAIDLSDVRKTYRGRVRALDGADIRVANGEVFGLLGPNGAGKSTLVKIIMTVIRPSHIEGKVLGRRVGHKPTLKRIGYLPEHHRFPDYLNGSQVLNFYAALAGVSRSERRKRAANLLDRVGMTQWARTNVAKYSKGMMQRVGLAQAMMNDPELILLDEPTDGVDPLGRKQIRDILTELKARGHTIFINSHLLSEVEMICDRVAVLVKGRTAMQGTLEELTKESRRIEIDYAGPVLDSLESFPGLRHDIGPAPHARDHTVGLTAAPAGDVSHQESDSVHRLIYPNATLEQAQPVIDRLRRNGATIRRFQPKADSLEDLFIKAVRLDSSEDAARPGARRGRKRS